MAIKSKKEQLEEWKKTIKISREYRKPFISHWKYWEEIYDGNLWGNQKFMSVNPLASKDKPVVINELDPIINNILPKIDFNFPVFDVDDMVSGNSLAALVYETYALKLFEYLDMFDTVREIILDGLVLGGGVHKTGILYDVEVSKYNLSEFSISNEMPMSQRVSPMNCLWDHRYSSWKEKRWFAEEIIKPVDEVKDSNIYENTANLKSNLSSLEELPKHMQTQFRASDLQDMVTLVELHDLTNGKIMTFTQGHDKFLQYDDDYGIEIYDQLIFTKTRPQRFWGKSVTQDIENHLVRLAYANHYMDEDVKQAARKIFEADTSIGRNVIALLESDSPRIILPIDGLTSMMAEPVREITTSANVFQWSSVMGIIERQIRGISGSTMQERGTHEPGVETKAEAEMLKASSETRNQDRALLLSMFVQNIMRKMLKLSSDFMQPERIAEIVGIPKEDAWMIEPFDNMKLSVKFGSTAIEARQMYMQKLMTVAQAFPDIVNRFNLMQKFMTALGFGMKDQDLLMQSQPTPQEQQVQQQGEQVPPSGSPF